MLDGAKGITITNENGEVIVDITLDNNSDEPIIEKDGYMTSFDYGGNRQFIGEGDKIYLKSALEEV